MRSYFSKFYSADHIFIFLHLQREEILDTIAAHNAKPGIIQVLAALLGLG
jgi:hypothetical protein